MKRLCFLLFFFFFQILEANGEVPAASGFFLSLKEANKNNVLLKDLIDRGVVYKQGKDQELRPAFVMCQAAVEEWLTSMLKEKKLRKVIGLIHTPLPPTPLCTEGEVSSTLVAPSILNDEKAVQTVKNRATSIRTFLKEGGILYAAYPQKSWNLRSEKEQKIFQSLLEQFPLNFFSLPFSQDCFPEAMTGASYLFQDAAGEWYAFSIQSLQAANSLEASAWALWLGSLKNPPIKERMREVTSSFLPLTGPFLSYRYRIIKKIFREVLLRY